MKKQNKRVAIKVYFKLDDVVQRQVYEQLQDFSKSLGVSLSNATGMALRRGVPLVKGDWDAMQKKK
jgi:hypothetical protein